MKIQQKTQIIPTRIKGLKISQAEERVNLTGNEMIPFQEGEHNGKIKITSFKGMSVYVFDPVVTDGKVSAEEYGRLYNAIRDNLLIYTPNASRKGLLVSTEHSIVNGELQLEFPNYVKEEGSNNITTVEFESITVSKELDYNRTLYNTLALKTTGDGDYVLTDNGKYIYIGDLALTNIKIKDNTNTSVYDLVTEAINLTNTNTPCIKWTTTKSGDNIYIDLFLAKATVDQDGIMSKEDKYKLDVTIPNELEGLREALNKEIQDRKDEITRVDGRIDKEIEERISEITRIENKFDSATDDLEGALQQEIADRKAGDTTITNNLNAFINTKGQPGGLASLDSNGLVPSSQLPSYVDDVLEYPTLSAFPATGETGKIYVTLDTNLTYRWSGTGYVEISKSLALGETSSTAYAGNNGKENRDALTSLPANLVSTVASPTANASNVVFNYTGTSKSGINYSTPTAKTLTIPAASSSAAGVMAAADKVKLDTTIPNQITDINNTITEIQDDITGINSGKVSKLTVAGSGNAVTTGSIVGDTLTLTKGATYNNYVHPVGNAPSKATGLYKFSTDATSHVNSVTAVTKADITALGIPAQDNNTTYTFANGSSGNFTVTPSGGSAQTVSIGKPATAGTADNAITVGGISPTAFVKKAGDTMTGVLKILDGKGEANGIQGETGYGLVMYNGTTATYLGMSIGTTYIRSGAWDLQHKRDNAYYAILDTYNYTNYVPTKTGTGASGTWNITSKGIQNHSISNSERLPDFFPDYEVYTWYNNIGTPTADWWSGITVRAGSADEGYSTYQLCGYVGKSSSNYNPRWRTSNPSANSWNAWRILATLEDNVASATKLQTRRLIFGKYFDGTANVEGQATVYGTNTTATDHYSTGGLQIREQGMVGNTQTSDEYAPRIGFHWGNRFGMCLIANMNGFKFMDNDLDAYASIHANKVFAPNGFWKESDIRLKTNVKPLEHTIEQICAIPTTSFIMNDKEQIGTIAQEIEELGFTEIVEDVETAASEVKDKEGFEVYTKDDVEYVKVKKVEYEMLSVIAIEGVKLLKDEIDKLKAEIETLKNK